jgi:hypothetical protein
MTPTQPLIILNQKLRRMSLRLITESQSSVSADNGSNDSVGNKKRRTGETSAQHRLLRLKYRTATDEDGMTQDYISPTISRPFFWTYLSSPSIFICWLQNVVQIVACRSPKICRKQLGTASIRIILA